MRSSRKNHGPVDQMLPPRRGVHRPWPGGGLERQHIADMASRPWLNTRRRRSRSISSLSRSRTDPLTGSLRSRHR